MIADVSKRIIPSVACRVIPVLFFVRDTSVFAGTHGQDKYLHANKLVSVYRPMLIENELLVEL